MSMYILYLIYELFVNVRGDFLNKNNIERPKKFDKAVYNKENYARFCYNIKPELKQEIDNYCADLGISKPEFLRRAIDLMKSQ